MQSQPTARPQAESVADHYARAFERAFSTIAAENIGRLSAPPTWDETALGSMLDDLAAARSERLQHATKTIDRHSQGLGEHFSKHASDHMERMTRVAIEVASLNTFLRYGWIQDERLVKIGSSLLERLDVDAGDQA